MAQNPGLGLWGSAVSATTNDDDEIGQDTLNMIGKLGFIDEPGSTQARFEHSRQANATNPYFPQMKEHSMPPVTGQAEYGRYDNGLFGGHSPLFQSQGGNFDRVVNPNADAQLFNRRSSFNLESRPQGDFGSPGLSSYMTSSPSTQYRDFRDFNRPTPPHSSSFLGNQVNQQHSNTAHGSPMQSSFHIQYYQDARHIPGGSDPRWASENQILSSSPMNPSMGNDHHTPSQSRVQPRIPTAKPAQTTKEPSSVSTLSQTLVTSNLVKKHQPRHTRPLPIVMQTAPKQRPQVNNPSHMYLMSDYEIETMIRNQLSSLQASESYTDDYYYQQMMKKGEGEKYILPLPERPMLVPRTLDSGIYASVLGKPVIHYSKTPKTMLQISSPKETTAEPSDSSNSSETTAAPLEKPSNRASIPTPIFDESSKMCSLKLRKLIESAYDSLLTVEEIDSGIRNQMMFHQYGRQGFDDRRGKAIQSIFDAFTLPELQFCVSSPVTTAFSQLYSLPKGRRLVGRSIAYLHPQHIAVLVAAFLKCPNLLSFTSIEESLATDQIIDSLSRAINNCNFEQTLKILEDVLLAKPGMDLLSSVLVYQPATKLITCVFEQINRCLMNCKENDIPLVPRWLAISHEITRRMDGTFADLLGSADDDIALLHFWAAMASLADPIQKKIMKANFAVFSLIKTIFSEITPMLPKTSHHTINLAKLLEIPL